jgi:restriction endonuclease S subunit
VTTVPAGWETATIGEVTGPVSKRRPEEEPEREFTYIDISSIEGQTITNPKRLLGSDAPSRARQIVRAGDTLLSTVRTYLKHTGLVPDDLDNAVASTGFCVMRPTAAVDPKFLFFRVLEQRFVDDLSTKQTGSSYPAVREADVREMPIAFPAVDEQQRIVAAIEEQFSRLDAAEAAIERVRIRAGTLGRTLVRLGVSGNGVTAHSLGECVEVLDSKRVPVNSKERAKRPGDVPYYGATGQVGWIDVPLFNEELVLLGEDGAPFLDADKTKAYVIDGPSWVNNHAHVFRALPGVVDSWYLKYALDCVDYHPLVTGTTRLKLTQAQMRRITIPLPDLVTQQRVVAELARQDSIISALREGGAAARRKAKALRSSVLRAAFTGRLTAWAGEATKAEGGVLV